MSVELLLREFARVADAPDALQALRPFIVELALRGELTGSARERLVAEPVSLERIYLGMATLLDSRTKYRWRRAAVPSRAGVETPHGWCATELANTGLYINGLAFKPSDWGAKGRPIIRIQNLSGLSRDYNCTDRDFLADNLVKSGDLLVSWSATLDTFLWDGPEGVVNQHIFKVIPNPEAATREFLYWLLKHEVRQLARSQHAHGLAMMHINRGPFLSHTVLLPPITEQHRIVAKVAELMALCDELEASQKERESRRDRLRSASLQRLTAIDGDGTPSAADVGFILRHSPRLITKPQHVAAIRQTILDLAVAGRLTRHPGVSLAWSDETLASVCDLIVDGDHNPPARQPSGIPHLTAKHISGGRIDVTGCTFISEEDFALRRKRYCPQSGDLILTCVGTLGRTAIVPDGFVFSADRNLAALRPQPSRCTSAYLKLVIDSPSVQGRLTTASGQTAQPHIYLKDIRAQTFSLPPLAEQHRIVAKVDELMTVCDELEAALESEQHGKGPLLEVLLHDALNGAATGRDS